MSAQSWPRALAYMLRVEGGYVNHPRDPGGATFAGVSLRAVVGLDADKDGRLDFDLDQDGDVDADDIRRLKDHPALVEQFYQERYWNELRCGAMPWPLDLAAFDAAVNHGVAAATFMLQRAIGVEADGRFGPHTLIAATSARPDAVARLLLERRALYFRLAAKRGNHFLAGWLARLVELSAEAFLGMPQRPTPGPTFGG